MATFATLRVSPGRYQEGTSYQVMKAFIETFFHIRTVHLDIIKVESIHQLMH